MLHIASKVIWYLTLIHHQIIYSDGWNVVLMVSTGKLVNNRYIDPMEEEEFSFFSKHR